MAVKKSFLIILRIVFVLFSLQFLKDAFYRWDGYSYYMRFIDLLPDLSLVFIIWAITGVIVAIASWLIVYVVPKIIQRLLINICFEHTMVWFMFAVIIMFIKLTFFSHISLSNLIGLNSFTIITISGILVAVVVWLLRKDNEKILYGLDTRITPLVWLFTVLFILAVPFSLFSVFKKEPPTAKYIRDSSVSSDKRYPNIILVTFDALTSLDMQVYGYDRPTTPFISEWAKEAIIFKEVYSASNWTTPSVMSLMTGQRAWTHKVWYSAFHSPVKDSKNNLSNILRDNGYNIYSFVQNHHAHPDTLGIGGSFFTKDRASTFTTYSIKGGLYSSIQRFYQDRGVVKDFFQAPPFTDIKELLKKLLSIKVSLKGKKPLQEEKSLQNSDNSYRTLTPPEIVFNRALNYFSQDIFKQPFFLWLHILPPHHPYLPPKPYMGLFGDTEKYDDLKDGDVIGKYQPEEQIKVDILRQRYDEFILYCDEQFRLFKNQLSKTIDMSKTIMILSSDHGESFSHGHQGHTTHHLYEPLVRIPLIIKMPEESRGKAIDMPVEQIDIAPTILELTGIPVPEWMEGRSLVPLIEGKPIEPRHIFATHLIRNRSFGHPITRGTIAVWDGDYKLIHYLEDQKQLLFNLKSDPDELRNIFEEEPDIVKKLKALIDDNLSRANDRITQSY